MAVGTVGQSQGASGVSFDFKPKKGPETVTDQENEQNNKMKPGIDNQKLEDEQNLEAVKGVQEVDAKV